MRLDPLLDLLSGDPAVRRVMDFRGSADVVDVAASPGARAPLLSLLTRAGDEARVPILAVTATGREAGDLSEALRSLLPEHAVAEFPSWETLPHERLSPRSDTVGRRLALLRRLAHPGPGGPRPGRRRRRERPRRPAAHRARTRRPGSRSSCGPGPTPGWRTSSRRSRARRTPGSTWSNAAASSPSAEASSTSSRRPRSTPSGWSSGATRSRRCAGSRSPTSARWRSPRAACGRRRAANCCSPTDVRERAPGARATARGRQRHARQGRRGHRRRGHGVPVADPARRRDAAAARRAAARHASSCSCDPERVRTRAADLVTTSEEFLDASWANAAAGNAVPVDLRGALGTASYWSLSQLRDHALADRPPMVVARRRSPPTRSSSSSPRTSSPGERVTLHTQEIPAYRSNTEHAVDDLRTWAADGQRVLVVTEGPGLAKRVTEVLSENDVTDPRSLGPLGPRHGRGRARGAWGAGSRCRPATWWSSPRPT